MCALRRARAGRIATAVFASVVMGCLLVAGSAPAANFTWTGGGALTERGWSNAANWGGAAPSGVVGSLTFPPLANPACVPIPPAAVCYQGINDLAGLTVETITIDDGVGYYLEGNPITLGGGGLTANTAATTAGHGATVRMPVTLSAPQTWSIDGNRGLGQLNVATVTGPADALSINLSNQTFLGVTGDMEVGTVIVTGVSPAFAPGNVAIGGGSGGSLNSADGNPVIFKDGAGLVGFGGAIGPLSMDGGQLQVGNPRVPTAPPGTFAVAGPLSLQSTELHTFIAQPGGAPGTDYWQLRVSGNVQLTGARLNVTSVSASGCPPLAVGELVTVLTTTGTLTGEFAGVPNGAIVPVSCNSSARPKVRINYGAHALTATVTETPSGAPLPILGKRETVSVISGIVTVRPLGRSRFVPLTAAKSVLDGSELDTTHGRALVTAATATPGASSSAEAYTGRFLIHQEKSTRAETHLSLSLPLTGCPRARARGAAPPPPAKTTRRRPMPTSRHLWVSEHGGSWGTNGRYVSTSVEGTTWLTLDECTRSEVKVSEGKVKVRNLVRRKTKTLSAGHSYIAAGKNRQHR